MQDLLNDLETELNEGDLDKVPLVIDRVLNTPNNVRQNMYSAVEFVQPDGTGNAKQTARETVSALPPPRLPPWPCDCSSDPCVDDLIGCNYALVHLVVPALTDCMRLREWLD